jgi:hypothetical protein
LKGALLKAKRAFLQVLDGYTLADFARRQDRLVPLWLGRRGRRSPQPLGKR